MEYGNKNHIILNYLLIIGERDFAISECSAKSFESVYGNS
jgi:hypothetical protein